MPKYVIVVEPVYHVVIEADNLKEAKRIAENVEDIGSLLETQNVDYVAQTDITCDECLTYEYKGALK